MRRNTLRRFPNSHRGGQDNLFKYQNKCRSILEIVSQLFGGEDPMAPMTKTNNQFTTENLIRSVLKMS